MHVMATELAELIHIKQPQLNRARLAEQSGVSVRTIRRILNGHFERVDVNTAERLIDAAGGYLFEVEVRDGNARDPSVYRNYPKGIPLPRDWRGRFV